MELALYLSQHKLLNSFDELMQSDSLSITSIFNNHASLISKEIKYHYMVIDWVKKVFNDQLNIAHLYFGNEFCEHLQPSKTSIKQAITLSKDKGLNFVYITPNPTQCGLKKVIANIDTVLSCIPDPVFVVNEMSLIDTIININPKASLILGRQLIKNKRDPYFTFVDHQPHSVSDQASILKKQVEYLSKTNLDIPEYKKWLIDHNCKRVSIDPVPYPLELGEIDFAIDLYLPWSIVQSSRNCETRALVDYKSRFYANTDACPMPCQSIELAIKSPEIKMLPSTHIGNTTFLENLTLINNFYYKDRQLDQNIDRLIIQPFLPL